MWNLAFWNVWKDCGQAKSKIIAWITLEIALQFPKEGILQQNNSAVDKKKKKKKETWKLVILSGKNGFFFTEPQLQKK